MPSVMAFATISAAMDFSNRALSTRTRARSRHDATSGVRSGEGSGVTTPLPSLVRDGPPGFPRNLPPRVRDRLERPLGRDPVLDRGKQANFEPSGERALPRPE